MTDPGEALFTAAMRLLGAPFRLHGRDPVTGLDCIGLLAAGLAAIGRVAPSPAGYSLRWDDLAAMDRTAKAAGLARAQGAARPGDVLLLRAGPAQLHLAIAAHRHMAIHAHAGLQRVVLSSIPDDWPLIRHWRLTPQ